MSELAMTSDLERPAMPFTVFISYRRIDADLHAGRIKHAIKAAFPDWDVFMDTGSNHAGEAFQKGIAETLAKSTIFLALIGKRWLGDKSSLINDTNDFVHSEIRFALARRMQIIPVLLDDARMPQARELPDAIAAVAALKSVPLRHSCFGDDCAILTDTIARRAHDIAPEGRLTRLREQLARRVTLSPSEILQNVDAPTALSRLCSFLDQSKSSEIVDTRHATRRGNGHIGSPGPAIALLTGRSEAGAPANGQTANERAGARLARTDTLRRPTSQHADIDIARQGLRNLLRCLAGALPERVEGFKATIEKKLLDAAKELLQLQQAVLLRTQEYRDFKVSQGLGREAKPAFSISVASALSILACAIGGFLNAIFLKDAVANDLPASFLLPFIISSINILSGAIGIVPLRYLNHGNRLHLLWAVPFVFMLLVAVALFNLSVGHYRELSLVHGDVPFTDAIAQMSKTLFGIDMFLSWAVLGLGLAMALLSAYSGYTIPDPYPGYGRARRRRENAIHAFEDRIRVIQREIHEYAFEYMARARQVYFASSEALRRAIAIADQALAGEVRCEDAARWIGKICGEVLWIHCRDSQVESRALCLPPLYWDTDYPPDPQEQELDSAKLEGIRSTLYRLKEELRQQIDELSDSIAQAAKSSMSEAALTQRMQRITAAAQEARDDG